MVGRRIIARRRLGGGSMSQQDHFRTRGNPSSLKYLGLSLIDSSIIFVPHFPLQISLRTHDTFAGNALMVGLFLGALVLTALPSVPAIRRMFACLCLSSWMLFCFSLKWSPFHTRLHTPLFILGAVLIGLMSCTPGLLRLAGHRHTQIAVSILYCVF